MTWQFVGLNILVISLAFSYVSAVDYSLMILAPSKGTLAEVTKRLGANMMGERGGESSKSEPPEPKQ